MRGMKHVSNNLANNIRRKRNLHLTGCGFCCFLLGIFQLAFLFATSSGFPRKQSTHSPKYPLKALT